MTDLELTKACAEAMGYRISDDSRFEESGLWCHLPAQHGEWYRPLSGDTYGNAQVMALVKKFKLQFGWYDRDGDGVAGDWCAAFYADGHRISSAYAQSDNANRAIVECVAKLKECHDQR